jgi:hypothetical protein
MAVWVEASPPSQNDLPILFKGLCRVCGRQQLDGYELLADRHNNFGRTRLLRRTDDTGYISLGYLGGAARHD